VSGRVRAVPCDAARRRARLRRALGFWDSAENLRELDGDVNGYTSLYVLAGIAAADVICCARLGEHSQSENHADSVRLMRAADPDLAASLQRLLSGKSADAYGAAAVSATRAKEVRAAAERLVEAARLWA
jgi:hypothetical protein